MTYPLRLRSPNFFLSREGLISHGYTRHTRRSARESASQSSLSGWLSVRICDRHPLTSEVLKVDERTCDGSDWLSILGHFYTRILKQLQRYELVKPRCFFPRNTPFG